MNAFLQAGRRQASHVLSEINEERKFFIKWDKKHNRLSLCFYTEEIIGSGFWKQCFSATTIRVSLTGQKKEIEQFASVWIKVDETTMHEITIQEFLYEQFIREMPKGVFFLEPWEQIHENIYHQKRLINRLEGTKFDDPVQRAYYMRDLARNLTWIHRHRIVHGDVHLKNTLAKEQTDDEGMFRLVSYLTDFGSAKRWGANEERKLDDYVRWDCCKCFADINTPLMDWHGFIVTNIVAHFPEMTSHLKWDKFISIRQLVFENESRGIVLSDDFYWVGYKDFSELPLLEQRAWLLFISLCRKSTQLYLYFRTSRGKISEEDVETAMIEINTAEVVEKCLQFADDLYHWATSIRGFKSL